MPGNEKKLFKELLTSAVTTLSEASQRFEPRCVQKEIGCITSLSSGIAKVSGLPHVGCEELIRFEGGHYGCAFDLKADEIGVILLDDITSFRAGMEGERTGRVMDVPVGEELLGRVVNALGKPIDGKGSIQSVARWPIEQEAPPIISRLPVTVPLQTGIKVIDALVPIGLGQRELILGDRQTGKTAIAIDTIVNQRDKDVLCVYCSIGQRSSSLAKVIADLTSHGALEYTIVVAVEGNEAPGLRYMAPYAATSMAEYFMGQGKNVLIVYDDLTQHAKAYRELSLLLRRPPGREAYPGDIFYLHARLLERATHVSSGGSLTALPIIETESRDISAYIPTNLISITDGQILVSSDLFEKGVLPAIEVGLSVSRVGGKAQCAAYREVAGNLKLYLSQFQELEEFSRFGTQLNESTRRALEHGRRIRWSLLQNRLHPLDVCTQIFILLACTEGLLDDVSEEKFPEAHAKLEAAAALLPPSVRDPIVEGKPLDEGMRQMLLAAAREAI